MDTPHNSDAPLSTEEAGRDSVDQTPSSDTPSNITPPDKPQDKQGKKTLLYVVAALVTVVALGIGAYLLVANKEPAAKTTTNTTNKPASNKTYRVGVVSGLEAFSAVGDGFKQKMTELGYTEGKNITYDIQKAPAPVGNQKLIQKFVDDKVDLILVFPTEAALETRDVAKNSGIPVLFGNAAIEGNNLVENVRKPGGNITGVRYPITEGALKRLEVLHQLAPTAKRIWLPHLKGYPTVAPALTAIKSQAQSMGVTIVEAPFANATELQAYLNARPATGDVGFDAILQIAEPMAAQPATSQIIFKFADAHKLPVGASSILEADYGGVFGLRPSNLNAGKQAASLADKIFKGTPAGSIPVVTADSDLEINHKALQKLGLTADEGLLSTAKRVYR